MDKAFVIGDLNLVLFFNTIGISGKTVNSSEEAYSVLKDEIKKKEKELIIVSKKMADEFPEDVMMMNLSGNKIIFPFPDDKKEGDNIASKVMKLLGVSI